MSHPDPTFDSNILEALARAQDLPSMPVVALEVLRLAGDEATSAEELASVLSLDPALAAQILKAANSPLFGGAAQIKTLQRACSQLGFSTVKLMALSFTLINSLDRPDVEGFDYDEHWKRSVVRAFSAKFVAEALAPKLADEAFITGLLSRIGQLVLANCLPRDYEVVLAAGGESWPSREREQTALGFSTDELSAALLHSWNLPTIVYEAVRYAHDPSEIREDLSAETKQLARTLSLAGRCEELVCGSSKANALIELYEAAQKLFALDAEKVRALLSQLSQPTATVAQILPIKIKGGPDMPNLLHEAQQGAFRETLAVLQRAVSAEQRVNELEFENAALLRKAQTDPLTGLADRSVFEKALACCLTQGPHGNRPQPVGLLMIDVDSFKRVNDTYGRPVGDQVLQLIARVLRESTGDNDLVARCDGEKFAVVMPQTTLTELRTVAERIRSAIEKQRLATATEEVSVQMIASALRVMIEDTDLVARHGGEEFAVVTPWAISDGLQTVAERVCAAIEKQRLAPTKTNISVTASIGGAHTDILDPPTPPEKLVDVACQNLYSAKHLGRNRCEFAATAVPTGEHRA